jgi:hypothetical protein
MRTIPNAVLFCWQGETLVFTAWANVLLVIDFNSVVLAMKYDILVHGPTC